MKKEEEEEEPSNLGKIVGPGSVRDAHKAASHGTSLDRVCQSPQSSPTDQCLHVHTISLYLSLSRCCYCLCVCVCVPKTCLLYPSFLRVHDQNNYRLDIDNSTKLPVGTNSCKLPLRHRTIICLSLQFVFRKIKDLPNVVQVLRNKKRTNKTHTVGIHSNH